MQSIKLKAVHRLRFLSVLVLFISLLTFSQDLKFDHFSVKQYLSPGNVLGIYQDKFSFLWIGTEDGLNLIDDYTFTLFRSNPKYAASLRNKHYCIAEDPSGNIGSELRTD